MQEVSPKPRDRRTARILLIAVLASVTLAAAIATVLRFTWLPRFRPALAPGDSYGLDVSNHQGTIDWNRVAAAGFSFAYIKATEGVGFVDPTFAANWQGAQAARMRVGAYHFFSLCSNGADQARGFLDQVPATPGALPPALDLELTPKCRARPQAAEVQRQIGSYLTTVEAATGQKVVLYVGSSFESLYPVKSWFDRPLWIQRFLQHPDEPWVMWQVDSMARVPGVVGGVDLDVMR